MINKKIINRLKRVEGQVAALQKQIEDKVPCQKMIPQFLAVKGGLEAAFYEYLETAILDCNAKDKKQLQQLVKFLIKK
jgi:DNA-binding FrmR family transcriptional regulator